MRISTAQFQRQGLELMLKQAVDLADTQQQLATGKRIQVPSDDPLALTQLLPLKTAVSTYNQYERNSDVAEYRLALEEIQLSNFGNILTRVNELAIQANNGTANSSDRTVIATEIRENIANLVSIANTQDANGDYIFAGDNVNTAPIVEAPVGTFTYTGDQGTRDVQVGQSRLISSGDSGRSVFMDVPFSGGGNQDIFTTLSNYATSLEANSPSALILTDVQAGLDNVLMTRTTIGARLNSLDVQTEDNEGRILRSKIAISRLEDVDFAETVSRLSIQLASLQASQQAFGRIQNLSLFNYL